MKSPHYQSLFHRAIRRYGPEAFEWEVIYQSKDRDHTLKLMEPYFIIEYRSFGEGYNMTTGGESGFCGKHTTETKRKLSQLAFERHRTKCYKMSEEEKQRRAVVMSKKWEITFPDGRVEIIENLKAFAKEHNLNQGNMVSVAKKRLLQHKGFRVKYMLT